MKYKVIPQIAEPSIVSGRKGSVGRDDEHED